MEISDDAIKHQDGHGYLFWDFKQQIQERMRIQTGLYQEMSLLYIELIKQKHFLFVFY